MLITRKKQIPVHWIFYAQLPFVLTIAANIVTQAPFLYAMKKFIDNPAAITFLISIEVFITMFGGPFANWLSDRIWTRHGRRKPFIIVSEIGKALTMAAMPFAPNLIWLISLRWLYGIVQDVGAPNQALTMEIVPAKQRGLGAGFFKLQQQVVNLVFFGLVVGRFDDVFFTGPFYDLISVSGETLTFLAGSIMFISVGFYVWFGIHEIEPPHKKMLRDERRPGESILGLFARSFFRDIFHKSLLPLYLLMLVGTLTTVNLGTLGPLLYTDQWGYTLQEMGTNIAISAFIGIGASLLAGWVADKTSKLKVYTVGLVLTLLSRVFWTVFVAMKPDHRPDLHEILLFGTVTNVFGLIAGAASFPLILEYVERNRLGTAGAGMGLFTSSVKNGFTMFVGFYVLWWSLLFLPQAGDRVDLVFKEEKAASALLAKLDAAGYPAHTLDLKPLHRPGVDDATSRHWKIRRSVEHAGDLHKQVKDLGNEIASLQLKAGLPGASADNLRALREQISSLSAQKRSISARLDASAEAFKTDLLRILGDDLEPEGAFIADAHVDEASERVSFTLEFVEPVTTDITPKSTFGALGLGSATPARKTVTSELARVLETVDINRRRAPNSRDYLLDLTAAPSSAHPNAVTISLVRDPDFVALERVLIGAGMSAASAYNLASNLILPIRGLSDQASSTYEISTPSASREHLAFELRLPPPEHGAPISAQDIQDALRLADGVADAVVEDAAGAYQVRLDLAPVTEAAVSGEDSVITARLRELLPAAAPADLRTLDTMIQRATEIAASKPIFLTASRPVVQATPADREYDYFFSMQYFMIITDVLGIGIVFLIVYLEKRGVVVRVGAKEDENR